MDEPVDAAETEDDDQLYQKKREKIEELSFNQRMEQIGGDNIKFNRRLKAETSAETYFQEVLEKWLDQDQGSDIEHFCKLVPRVEVTTYAQFLNHSSKIFESLQQCMRKPKCKSLPAFCDLLAAFARDMREKFVDFMWQSFDVLITILESGDREADNVEAAFISLTTLVKLCGSQLTKQMKKTFANFLPLFDSSRNYARRFAAESFAYLMRKVADMRPVVHFILRQAYKGQQEYLTDGCAMLFSSVYVGVAGGFHSSAKELLQTMLKALLSAEAEDEESSAEFKEFSILIFVQSMCYTVEYAKKSSSPNGFFYQEVLIKLLGEAETIDDGVALMRLLSSCIFEEASKSVVAERRKRKEKAKKKAKKANTVVDQTCDFRFVDDLKKSLLAVVKVEDFALLDNVVEFFSKALLTVFNNPSGRLFAKDITLTIVQKSTDLHQVISLLLKLVELDSFDLYLMPALGKVAHQILQNNEVDSVLVTQIWRFYAFLCLRRRPISETLQRDGQRITFFDLKPHRESSTWLLNALKGNLGELARKNRELLMNLLVAWPWLCTNSESLEAAEEVKQFLQSELRGIAKDVASSQLAFVATASLFTVSRTLLGDVSQESMEAFVERHNCCESSLLAFEIVVEVRSSPSSVHYLERVAKLLTPGLMSPADDARRAALRILRSFDAPLEAQNGSDGHLTQEKQVSLFEILYDAECSELTNFRERLLQLRKLRFGPHRKHMPLGHQAEFEHLVVRLCVSQFFVQFTPLWKGIHEVLTSYARGMNIDSFWSVMTECVDNVQNKLASISYEIVETNASTGLPNVDQLNRSDYVNARIQLFLFFSTIPDVAEPRTRVLSPILLKLYREEYLRLLETPRENPSEDETLPEENNEEQEGELVHRPKANRQRKEVNDVIKAFHALLTVFSKFSDAKSTFLEPKLKEMYNDLLQCSNESLQQIAFACILSYKDHVLTRYSKQLEGLLSEKTMRERMTTFKISEDEEDAELQSEHRSVVMPVLLRILHGKLAGREAKKGGMSLRNGVFRMIGGCRPNELKFFLDLHFAVVDQFFGKDSSFADVAEKCGTDDFHTFNVQLLTRLLRDVSEMLRKIARTVAAEEQKQLLHVLLASSIVVRKAILATEENVSELLKDLRMSVCDRIGEFLAAFPSRQWRIEELAALRDHVLGGYIERLSASNVVDESTEALPIAPFAVVKLLATIAKLPPCYQLFSIQIDWSTKSGQTNTATALEVLLAPLMWTGRFELMVRTVRSAVLQMAQLADEPLVAIPAELQCLKVQTQKDVNFGTCLLLTKIRFLLAFLTREIESEVATIQKPSLENIDLLNRLSDYVNDAEMSKRLATPLFTCVERRKCKEDVLMHMLNSLARIALLVDQPNDFISRIGPLCSKISGRNVREALVQMTESFAKSPKTDKKTRDFLQLFADLEAWDKTKVDEPNFDRRYGAYSTLNKIWSGDDAVELHILTIFVHTHMHLIATTTDMSLRMAAGNNLRGLVQFAGRNLHGEPGLKSPRKAIVDVHFSQLIIHHLRSDIEAVRGEALTTFVVLVDSFADHPLLGEFKKLRNADEDVDFLLNMNHVQTHRRQRAMRRLVEEISVKKVSLEFAAMNKYLLPMVSPYLVNVASKTSALSDEALRVLTAVMLQAPWPKYVTCLEYWLGRVENHSLNSEISDRALVRVLVAVIDAFHYDLNAVVDKQEQKGKRKEDDEEVEAMEVDAAESKANAENLSILDKLTKKILPRLTRSLNAQTDAVERNARTMQTKMYAEDFDIQRAPMALATVKLLQKLPEALRSRHLHGVVLKLCNLMISRSHNVREAARKTAVQVCEVLGTKYLPFVIKEMVLVMKKGFQLHVVVYSVHMLILSLKDQLQSGDLDAAIGPIMKLCVQDQFETVAEEKELGSLKADVPEAKANRTPETLSQLGRVVSASGIEMVLEPLRTVVDAKPSAKVILRVSELLSKFVFGLKENKGISPTLLLTYIFKSLSGDLKKMADVENRDDDGKGDDAKSRRPESCLIIPKAPKRIGAITKTIVRSRVHVFAEFSAQLFAALLYGKVLDTSTKESTSRLNPFVKVVLECLRFKYDKLIIHSLRALTSMIQLNLPGIKSNLKEISNRLFLLLSDYCAQGNATSKPQAQQLNQLLYKAFTQLISYAGSNFLSKDNLSLLLAYSEVDVLDSQRQATMFSLLKMLVRKGVRHERLEEIMDHLAETAIKSPIQSVRAQCRETLVGYIGGASDRHKDAAKQIEFFLCQLVYEYEDGRLSAAEMLKMLFTNLTNKALVDIHMLCAVKLGSALVNESSSKCATAFGAALRQLLRSVGVAQRQEVFESCCTWLETQDESARSVGIQVASHLAAVEKETFAPRMKDLMQPVMNIFSEGELYEENSGSTLLQLTSSLTSLLGSVGTDACKYFEFNGFFDSLDELVKCDDELPIRHEACKLVGQCLAILPECQPIDTDRARIVADWMCFVLRHDVLDAVVAEQASKNIVFIAKYLKEDKFAHVLSQIAQACRFEIKVQTKTYLRRTSCFKLAMALALAEEEKNLRVVLDVFMPLFVREVSGKSKQEELANLSNEICDLVRKKLGDDEYSRRFSKAQQEAAKRVSERKRKIKEMAVTAPEDAAKLRSKHNRKKTEARKRKLDVLKPYRVAKRRHMEAMRAQRDDDDE